MGFLKYKSMNYNLTPKNFIAVLIILRVLISGQASASHSMGADMTYTCLGGNQYRITLSFYRDCFGSPAPSNPSILITSASCAQNLNVTLNPVPGTGDEVTPSCSSSVSTCNGGSFTGIEEWVYEGVVTLPMQCADWVFGYTLCCRNAAISTINSPNTNTFYINSTLNNLVTPCNSSPTFSNKPVPFLCRGQQFCFNHGAYDVDGDSLVYELITPRQNASTNVSYNAPYTAANPLNSVPATSFNTANGDICLTPQSIEVTVTAVLVKEYRNGVLIGTVERDLQLTVMNCSNNLPTLTGIDGTNSFTTSACANEQNCFTINSSDPDGSQQLTVTWNSSIPGATFNTTGGSNPTATFCWIPTTANIGHSYDFTVTVMDNACPYYGSQTFSYTLNVTGLSVNAGPNQAVSCGSLANINAVASGGTGAYTYLWNNGATTSSISAAPGTYIVTVSNGGCSASDTVTISTPAVPTADFNAPNNACPFVPVSFTNQSTVSSGSITGYSWNFGDGGTSTQQNPVHQFASGGTYTVTLIVTASSGCRDTTTEQILIRNAPVASFTWDDQCLNTAVDFTNTSPPPTTSWNWSFGDGGTSTQQHPSHTYTSTGNYNVRLVVTNSFGCLDTAVQTITITNPVANAGSDRYMCLGNSLTITATGGTSYAWSPGGYSTSTISVSPSTTTIYTVTVTDANGCTDTDAVTVSINPLPAVSAGTDKSICMGSSTALTASGANLYSWVPGPYATPSITVSPTVTTTYTVVGTNANGCSNTDQVTVTVNNLPVVNAGADDDICAGQSATLNASGALSYAWNPSGSSSSSINVTPASTITYTVVGIDASGCTASDAVTVNVHPNPVINIGNSNFNCYGDTAHLNAGNSGSTYSWSTGSTSQVLSVTNAGTYTVTVTSPNGCQSTASSVITINGSMNVPPANYSICAGQSINLNASGVNGSYQWSNGATTQMINVSNAGTYAVTITDVNGCSATNEHILKINSLPVPAFSATSVCQGLATSFTDLSTVAGGSSIQYVNWDFGDGNSSTNPSATNTYTAAGSYQVTLTVTADNGCTSSTSSQVIVHPLPVAMFSSTPTCQNTDVIFTNSSSVFPGNITSYAWMFGDGTTANSISPRHQYASDGTYQASLVASSDNGCIDTVSQSVVILDIPTAQHAASNTCQFGSVQFNNTSAAGGSPINTYQWNFGNGTSSSAVQPNITFTSAGTYHVRLIVTDGNNCVDTSIVPLTIYPKPNAAFAAPSVCSGLQVNFQDASSIASGSIQHYAWNLGDNSYSFISNPSHLYQATGQYPVTLIITSDNGCADTANTNVNVYPMPVPMFSTSDRCHGNSIYFTDSSMISAGNIPGRHWDFGDGTNSSQISPSHIYSNSGSYTVTLTLTSGQGCETSYSRVVNVFPNPVAAFISSNACHGSNTQFLNQSGIQGNGPLTYDWDFGDGNSSQVQSPVHLYTNSGKYNTSLLVTSPHGCSGQASDSVIIYRKPHTRFASPGNCTGAPVTFTNQSNSLDGNITSTMWTFGDGSTSTDPNPYHTYADSGKYQVELLTVTSFGCTGRYTDSVEAYSHPTVDIHMNNACEGTPVTFNATSNLGNGINYSWMVGNSVVSTNPGFTQVFNMPGQYGVKLTATTAQGCNGTAMSQVQIFPKPVATFATSEVCQNSPTFFVNQTTVPGGAIGNYSWNFGDSNHSGQNNPSHTYASSGIFNATLTAVSDKGCTSNYTRQVRVNPNPVATFAAGAQGCSPVVAGFTGTGVISSGTVSSYAWNFGDGHTSNDVQPTHEYKQAGSYHVTLTVVSDKGCQASQTQANVITVHPAPVADFTADPLIVDAQMPLVNFRNESQGYSSYQWHFGDGETSSTELNPSHMFSDTGVYQAMLITVNNFGCRDTIMHRIEVKLHSTLFVANAFTPNGDGINDVFQPKHTNMEGMHVWIFDRWGKLLTNWDGMDGSWDGSYLGNTCQADTYVYKIVGTGVDGLHSEWVGHVSIIF